MPEGATGHQAAFIMGDIVEDEKLIKTPNKGMPIANPYDAHTLNPIPN
jgi:hypothetical protein